MPDPRSPQQQATETQSCRSPEKNHGCQHVISGDPEAYRQTGGTLGIVAGFQAGQPEREDSRAEKSCQDCCKLVYRHSEQQRYHRCRTDQCRQPHEYFKAAGQGQQASQRHRVSFLRFRPFRFSMNTGAISVELPIGNSQSLAPRHSVSVR